MTAPVVRLAEVSFGYAGKVSARADLEVCAGEVVALLGANGSGKSTLVKGMLGLVDQHGGDVEWFGRPLGARKDRWRIGYVPQRELAASPIPATLEEIVRTGRVARTGVFGRYRASDREAVLGAIETVGLSANRRMPMRQLSGGQQRRALVARALAGSPDVLVLDEPFAGVDRESQGALAGTFRTLSERSVTLIVVLHELGSLRDLVTRCVRLSEGDVVYDGPPGPAMTVDDDFDPHCGVEPDRSFGAAPRLGLLT